MPSARLRSINRRSNSRMSSVTMCDQPFERSQREFLRGFFTDPAIKVGCVKIGRKAICQGSLIEKIGGAAVGAVLAEAVRNDVLDRDHQHERSFIDPYHAQEPAICISVEQRAADAFHTDPQFRMVKPSKQVTAAIFASEAARDQRRLDRRRIDDDEVKVV